MTTVAVLGLGIMGSGIASNIQKAGYALRVYNRTAEKAQPVVALGAKEASTPREAADGADVIISCVGDDEASKTMFLGADGALSSIKHGAVVVECSTLTLGWVRELAQAAQQKGASLLDAPMTGSKAQAAGGSLGLLIGGDAQEFENVKPVLESFTSWLAVLGPSGSGTLMKLINNMMGGVQAAVLAEGLVMAERGGLDMEQVAKLIINGATGSGMVKAKIGTMMASNYSDTNFALRWMHKDCGYALAAADEFGVAVPLVAAARQVYRVARNLGHSDEDVASVIEAVRIRKD